MTKTLRSGIFPCTTGPHLPFLIYFGLGDDPRVRSAFAFLIEEMSTENALDCGRYLASRLLVGRNCGAQWLGCAPHRHALSTIQTSCEAPG